MINDEFNTIWSITYLSTPFIELFASVLLLVLNFFTLILQLQKNPSYVLKGTMQLI